MGTTKLQTGRLRYSMARRVRALSTEEEGADAGAIPGLKARCEGSSLVSDVEGGGVAGSLGDLGIANGMRSMRCCGLFVTTGAYWILDVAALGEGGGFSLLGMKDGLVVTAAGGEGGGGVDGVVVMGASGSGGEGGLWGEGKVARGDKVVRGGGGFWNWIGKGVLVGWILC